MKTRLLIATLLSIVAGLRSAIAAQEAYAVYTSDDTKLTFYYDNLRNSRTGKSYDLNVGNTDPGWKADRTNANVTRVVFTSSFANARPTSTYLWFYQMKNLKDIDGISYLNTSEVTTMFSMFYQCESLTDLDVSGFNTSKVTNMGYMFNGCTKLESLDVSGFNTANVTNMDYLFSDVNKVTHLDVSHFNTSKVESMRGMFYLCTTLESVDVSHFNTSKVKDMSYMFCMCGLKSLNLSSFNTESVTAMHAMFNVVNNLLYLDLSSFNTASVTDMSAMFASSKKLKAIYVSGSWSTAKVTNSKNMFNNCTSLVGGEGTKWSESHIDAAYAHLDQGSSNPGYLSGPREIYVVFTSNNTTLTFYYDASKQKRSGIFYTLNTGGNHPLWYNDGTYKQVTKVVFDDTFVDARPTTTNGWFLNMSKLTEIKDISNLNTSEVTTMSYMFSGCSILTTLAVSHFNTEKVTNMYSLFASCHALKNLDVSNFNTENVTNMAGLFYECRALTSIDVSHFNTQKVTTMRYMFSRCNRLTNLDLSHFSTKSVTNMYCMFYGSKALTTLDLGSWNTSNVTEMLAMFKDCQSLTKITVSEGWNMDNVQSYDNMFQGCVKLKGEQGTAYDSNHADGAYAHIDGGTSNPGYLSSAGPDAYVVYSADNTTLTFCYDNQKALRTGNVYALNTEGNLPDWYNDQAPLQATKAVFEASFAQVRPTSTYGWFCNMEKLTQIQGISYLNTSDVTTMSKMFNGCFALKSLDLSHFNTEKMSKMSEMFRYCKTLTNLDLSHFNTDKVLGMVSLFANCFALKNINLIGWDTPNVADMSNMFDNCTSLVKIAVDKDWDMSLLKKSDKMFVNCFNLKGDLGTTYNQLYTDASYAHIDGGTSNPGYFSTRRGYVVHNGVKMTFYYDQNFNMHSADGTVFPLNTNPYVVPEWVQDGLSYNITTVIFDSSFADARPVFTTGWFDDMSKLATINGLSYLNTSETVNMNSMFKGCKLLKTLDLTNFNTENVENMEWMFHGCEALTTIYVGGRWNTSKVTNSYQMFQGCTNLVGGNGTTYNASHVDVTYARFDTETTPGYLTMRPYVVFADGELTFYCDGKNGQRDGTEYGLNSAMSLPQWVGVKESVVTAKFDTSFANARPTSTANWFYAMPNLTDIRGLKYLNTSKVVYMKSMFYMLHMTTLDLSDFNTSSVKNMESMFSQCFNLRTIVVGDGWTTAGVTSSAKMFEACYNLVGGAGTSYTADYINADYAHVDGGPGNPGYLTSLEQFSNYDLWIAGIRVTKNNKDNLGELVAELSEEAMERYFEGEMDVTFDGNTLTLQNAIINSTGDDGIRSKISDLKINVYGQNTITTNNNIGINIENNSGDGSVTFLGNGSLDIKSQRAAGLRTNIDVVLKGGVKMTAESIQGMGIHGWKSTAAAAYPSLTMYGYETMLNAKGSGTGSLRGFHALNLNDGLKIIQPEGATFKADDGVLTASGNIQYDWVIIATQDFYDGMAPHMGSTIKSGNTYNLAGQKVGADYKGIVVRDGKKMLVK